MCVFGVDKFEELKQIGCTEYGEGVILASGSGVKVRL